MGIEFVVKQGFIITVGKTITVIIIVGYTMQTTVITISLC